MTSGRWDYTSICERCGEKSAAMIGSMFNKQWICLGCKDRETQHPDYEKAVQADIEAIKRGDFNFAGIGLPEDL